MRSLQPAGRMASRGTFHWQLPKGTWKRSAGQVLVACPDCGSVAALDHEVSGDGAVRPSLVCPVEECSFHDFVRLEGWR